MGSVQKLAERLAELPGVVAVARTTDDDWGLGVYYDRKLRAKEVLALGFPGELGEPGAWGRLANGGGWLEADGARVTVRYRDLHAVEKWVEEARKGRFEVEAAAGFVAGMATYVLAAELALGAVLKGELPQPEDFPSALREAAPQRWREDVDVSLATAERAAEHGDVAPCAGLLVRAALAEAQALLAAAGEWALNERGILRRAGLGAVEPTFALVGLRPSELTRSVARVRAELARS